MALTCNAKWMKTSALTFIVFAAAFMGFARAPAMTAKEMAGHPAKVTRACCAFGTEMPVIVIPFFTLSQITSLEYIGPHHFWGNKAEGNGIIYTKKGGFIDLGHLRDWADWTAYLYNFLMATRGAKAEVVKKLNHEGGSKTLVLTIPPDLDTLDAVTLAGRIAFDLSLWHEIATWYGVSFVPVVPEIFSSFSPEDLYSNLLGVTLGMEAIKSELEYEEAMTAMLGDMLDSLGAAQTRSETIAAIERTESIWWTREKKLPSKQLLLQRYLFDDMCLEPWTLPGDEGQERLYSLEVPATTSKGQPLSELYLLNIDLNYKFPVRSIFPERNSRIINQHDFDHLINYIRKSLEQEEKELSSIVRFE